MTLRYLFSSRLRSLRYLWRRLRLGFDERDCWNLDVELSKWLSVRLLHMAKVTLATPIRFKNSDDNTINDGYLLSDTVMEKLWKDNLEWAGKSLEAYAATAYDHSSNNLEEAQRALRFVANNLGSLWD